MAHIDEVLHWLDGLHTPVTLTDELKQEILDEVNNIDEL